MNQRIGGEAPLETMLTAGEARPVFLQGVYPFLGQGLTNLQAVSPDLTYTVPKGCAAVLMYFRGGNASDQMIYLTVMRDDRPSRYFPLSPQGDSHVELAIREPIPAGTRLEIHLAASEGVFGTVVLDVGFAEWTERP